MTTRRAEPRWDEKRNRWQLNIQKDGKRKTITSTKKGRAGKHECEAKADDWLERGTEDMRFKDAWSAYISDYKAQVKENTYSKVESTYRLYIAPHIPQTAIIADITPMRWQVCIDKAYENGKHRKTLMAIRGVISSFIDFCRRNRWEVDLYGAKDLRIPKDAITDKREVLSPTDMRILFESDTIQHYGMAKKCHYIHAWRLIVLTGLRRGELTALKWEDVQEESIIHVHASINRLLEMTNGKTENADRYVALSNRAKAELKEQREYLKQQGIVSPYIFPDAEAKLSNPNNIYKQWKVYADQHGIKCSLHELRHTFVSAVKVQMPESLLKQQVGHSENVDTIGLYGHRMDGDIAATAKVIDGVFDIFLEAQAQ